ncbi:MAG: hypothetical protein IAE90_09140 [Ignavibacteria bacterium]|nr:hypothetical protein [Ignavibacteria bacterium]
MKNYYTIALIVVFFFCFSSITHSQKSKESGTISEEAWQKEFDSLKAEKKSLIKSSKSLDLEIDSLKLNSVYLDKLKKECDSCTYALVGKRNSAELVNFRKYFEESEKILNLKEGSYSDAKERYEKLLLQPEKCLPEFAERLFKLKDKLRYWPHDDSQHK